MRCTIGLLSLLLFSCASAPTGGDGEPAAPPVPAPPPTAASVLQRYPQWPAGTDAVAVWTGDALLVWGGRRGEWKQSNSSLDSNVYEKPPLTATLWTSNETLATATELSGPPDVEPRLQPSAVWTGEEMIIWGGVRDGIGRLQFGKTLADGASFHAATNSWTPLPEVPAEEAAGRYGHHAVWTGSAMLIWGGTRMGPRGSPARGYRSSPAETLLIYRPEQRRWQQIPEPDKSLYDRTGFFAVWTGKELVTLSHDTVTDATGTLQSGFSLQSYDPDRGSWRARSSPPEGAQIFTSTRTDASAIWMLGYRTSRAPRVPAIHRYDLDADEWQSWSLELAAGCSEAFQAAQGKPVWTDRHVVIMSPYAGCAIDWQTRKGQAFSNRRVGHDVAFWTGSQLLSWGGTRTQTRRGPVYHPRNVSTLGGSVMTLYDPTTGELAVPPYTPRPKPARPDYGGKVPPKRSMAR